MDVQDIIRSIVYVPLIGLTFRTVMAQQAYCFAQCYDCANPSPRLCPPETILNYYDCCIDGCCQYLKWPNVIFLVIVIIALLCGCFCCCFFLVNEANQRNKNDNSPDEVGPTRRRKKSARRQQQDNEIATIEDAVRRTRGPSVSPIPPPRYGDRRSTVV
ncbi:hypothetical protein M3Y94_00120100 [Aphelenchoides besseyi]|nr:hypothetical protein M3Y94_00120100 [Aphelenchoides besseyi]KAI6237430.1 hypothetical protein M3Y95_00264200 [Aphelenchoides besseyi]